MATSIHKTQGAARQASAWFAPLAAALLLSACSSSVVPPAGSSGGYAPPSRRPMPQGIPAFPGVIGVDARALTRLFGEPRLDIRDPTARKLQFGNGRCVLDAYLYPPDARGEPVVSFAEARASDGTAMDWADCAAQLSRR